MSTRKAAKLAAVESPAAKLETKAVPLVNVWDVYGEDISPWLTAELAFDLNKEAGAVEGKGWYAKSWQWVMFYCLVQNAAEAEADDLLSFADVMEDHVRRIREAAEAKRKAVAA